MCICVYTCIYTYIYIYIYTYPATPGLAATALMNQRAALAGLPSERWASP